jgi:hypothetical protein
MTSFGGPSITRMLLTVGADRITVNPPLHVVGGAVHWQLMACLPPRAAQQTNSGRLQPAAFILSGLPLFARLGWFPSLLTCRTCSGPPLPSKAMEGGGPRGDVKPPPGRTEYTRTPTPPRKGSKPVGHHQRHDPAGRATTIDQGPLRAAGAIVVGRFYAGGRSGRPTRQKETPVGAGVAGPLRLT